MFNNDDGDITPVMMITTDTVLTAVLMLLENLGSNEWWSRLRY